MPELPEVETTLRGIEKALTGEQIVRLQVRESRLRWPIPDDLSERIAGRCIVSLKRRAKYILINLEHGSLIWHLGMSGSMRIVDGATKLRKHDHVDLQLNNGMLLRYNDPRRFGCLLWAEDALVHPLLATLGPEPLSEAFDGRYLHKKSRGRRVAVKPFIMDQKVVVGVGNIYASEALFLAGIRPARQASRISRARYEVLAEQIKLVLQGAIARGGTTLRDFSQADGRPGYFEQQLTVYGRHNQPCRQCGHAIRNKVIGQRASYYCPVCQP
ncbi:MAG: bifunctional DNA-formamidopyrimidine glycosylase/DNA-(apurinic or apyrimidinic site) lyase [Proteobacteria bacterium]|nr:bifunctional DNA-formamidopyrimidine glycosylase/DNA-(apurinic or apyrimidinic site) lyase [Pseudomonadota bacterium]